MILTMILLSGIVWLTYHYSIKSGFCSDDMAGILEYDGKLDLKHDSIYGRLSKWLRYHITGGNFPSDFNSPDGTPVPMGKRPFRHHLLSIVIFNLAILSTHFFLSSIIGLKLSTLSCLLMIVHPLCVQSVAWCSGIGYPLCLLWLTLSLNLAQWFHSSSHGPLVWICTLIVFALLQFLCVNALFAGIMSCVILGFLGYWWFAIFSLIISIVTCREVFNWTINHRKQQFKKQAMGDSTFLHWRKIIVAIKTYVYYIFLSFFPKRLGLYHTWGYHYGPYLERDDRRFYLSAILTTILAYTFFVCPIYPVKFAIIWFTSFIWIFLNWVTIQQFIAERYATIPVIGVCIIIAYFTQGTPIYWIIFGLFLMRTWVHLPTFDNELKFYQSNVWNFPSSEVAHGNLGVTQVRMGNLGSALDSWNKGVEINKEYDVSYYNLGSRYKATALQMFDTNQFAQGIESLKIAHGYLEKAINCKICHFKKQWLKELEEMTLWIKDPIQFVLKEYSAMLKRDRKLVKIICRTKNKKSLASLENGLKDVRIKLQYWGNHIYNDIQGIDKQIKAFDLRLTIPELKDDEKARIEVSKKELSDRLSLLRKVLNGK